MVYRFLLLLDAGTGKDKRNVGHFIIEADMLGHHAVGCHAVAVVRHNYDNRVSSGRGGVEGFQYAVYLLGHHLGVMLEGGDVVTIVFFVPMGSLCHAAVTATDILYGSRNIAPVFHIKVVRQFGQRSADRPVGVYSCVFADESADIMRVLKICNADKRFFRRIAEVGNGILAGSYIQETVIVDRKFGIGEWLGYRFFMFEASQ